MSTLVSTLPNFDRAMASEEDSLDAYSRSPSALFSTLPITRTASTSSRRSKPPTVGASPPSFLKPTDGSRTGSASTARSKSIPKAPTTSSGASAAGSGRRYRTAVARDEAIDQARRKAVELRAIRDGLIAAPEPEPEVAPKTTIGDAIDAYLRYVQMQRKPRTHLTYRYTLDTLLRAAYKKKYVEDATRDDVLDFMTYCYEQGLGARTVYDKVVTVLQLFKKHGRSGPDGKGRLAELRRYHPPDLRAGRVGGDVQGGD